jgi:uncharacterized membrane protein YgcG
MLMHRWTRVVPLVALAVFAAPRLEAAGVRDRAGMFNEEVVRKVESRLDRIERRTGVPVIIETIDSIPGLAAGASTQEKSRAVETLADRRASEIGYEGVYLLISSKDHVFSRLLVKSRYESLLPRERRQEVRDALVSRFKAQRFDEGLEKAVEILDRSLSAEPVVLEHRPVAARPLHRGQAAGGKFGLGSLLMIGLGIFGVLLLFRVLGGLFNRGGAYPGGMGMGGMNRPGMGPGYGGPGYGGPGFGYGGPRGGGFFSGMLGGLGGALAGNWLYDQFSGRHGDAGHTDAASYHPGEAPASYDPSGDAFVGADDNGGAGTSWDDPTGGGDGGGDWGGGDGGGDWGGGGGDWGGGDGGGW